MIWKIKWVFLPNYCVFYDAEVSKLGEDVVNLGSVFSILVEERWCSMLIWYQT